jgi:hypothetical protein
VKNTLSKNGVIGNPLGSCPGNVSSTLTSCNDKNESSISTCVNRNRAIKRPVVDMGLAR